MAEKRLIYAEDLFEPVDCSVLMLHKGGQQSGKTMAMYEEIFRKRVEMAPTVDAEPVVHAYWIKEQDENGIDRGWKCSNCRGSVYEMTYEPYEGCPHCRAKMDLEVTDNGKTEEAANCKMPHMPSKAD
jgi:hypothetical protein